MEAVRTRAEIIIIYYYDLRITDIIPAKLVHMITADVVDTGCTGLARITLGNGCVLYYYVKYRDY